MQPGLAYADKPLVVSADLLNVSLIKQKKKKKLLFPYFEIGTANGKLSIRFWLSTRLGAKHISIHGRQESAHTR